MYYKDVEECLFKKRSKKIGMIGPVDVVSYSYDSNGKLIEEFKEEKQESFTFVNFTSEPKINFVSEVENHTPLKVGIQDKG